MNSGCLSFHSTLSSEVAAAADKENLKRGEYHDLRKPNTEIVPVVLETTGGYWDKALTFLKKNCHKDLCKEQRRRELA